MNLTCIRYLNGKGAVNGVEFNGVHDVSELIGEHDVQGDFTSHIHTLESAIELSAKLHYKILELDQRNNELEIALQAFDNIILLGGSL